MFVIDSETVETDLCDVAEYEIYKNLNHKNYLIFIHFRLLYRILTDVTLQSNKSKIIVLCNKQDKLMAKGSEVIKTLLEKELYVFKQLFNYLM
jgi:signal recognition particle receptor subunit beta